MPPHARRLRARAARASARRLTRSAPAPRNVHPAGGSAIAYANHHLASFFVAATALSAVDDALDLVSGPPLSLSSGGAALTYVMMLVVLCLKAASAALVAHLDERSGSGYSAYLLPAEGR